MCLSAVEHPGRQTAVPAQGPDVAHLSVSFFAQTDRGNPIERVASSCIREGSYNLSEFGEKSCGIVSIDHSRLFI